MHKCAAKTRLSTWNIWGRYTSGDEALRDELLGLFADQLVCQLDLMGGNCTGHDWVIATHTLKGAARAVGAFQIAQTAEALERLDPVEQPGDVDELIGTLRAQAETCRAFITSLAEAA